jgi:hypothetical protein
MHLLNEGYKVKIVSIHSLHHYKQLYGSIFFNVIVYATPLSNVMSVLN